MSNLRPSVRRCGALLAAAAVLLSGCADASEADEAGLTLRLVIPDAKIRVPGVPCSGASGFRFAHPETPFTIQNADGEEVASGELPEGVAEKAFNIDLGEERQPTVCVMMLNIPGVDTLDDHSLVIEDRSPVPIVPNPDLDGMPEVTLR